MVANDLATIVKEDYVEAVKPFWMNCFDCINLWLNQSWEFCTSQRTWAYSYSICHGKFLSNVYIAYYRMFLVNGNDTRRLSMHGMWFGIWLGRWSKTSWRAASRYGSESNRRDSGIIAKEVTTKKGSAKYPYGWNYSLCQYEECLAELCILKNDCKLVNRNYEVS